jgi:hypothetical protein
MHKEKRFDSPSHLHGALPGILITADMTPEALEKSALSGDDMPVDLSPARQALWLARAGKWHQAHERCQNISGGAGSWIHAHLHRQEGDHSNAAYWYSLAGKSVPAKNVTINQEWYELVAAL